MKRLEARAGEGTYQLCTPVLLEMAVDITRPLDCVKDHTSHFYLCCETFEPLEAVKRLKAGACEGLPRDPDGRAVLKQQAFPQG